MKNFSEVRDNMLIEWDVPVKMRDGVTLRCDVFRPNDQNGKYPVLLSYGPYGKGLAFQEGYPDSWIAMVHKFPDVAYGSSNKYQSWEVADPEKWVPDGYVLVRFDSRGAGNSPGFFQPFSKIEAQDIYECIEWSGIQPWSSGKVGMSGISYYAVNQWMAAALRPPHLAACCIWEGFCDHYRDSIRHGGILSTFFEEWFEMQCFKIQHGKGDYGLKSRVTGENVSGDETLTPVQLAENRMDYRAELSDSHVIDKKYFNDRISSPEKIEVPLLSCGNWGGQGLHLRGNTEGYLAAGSQEKYLEIHGHEHWTGYYTDYGVNLQKKFFGHYLKGESTGWDKQPSVQLQIRYPGEQFVERCEDAWPIPRTKWTPYYINAQNPELSQDKPASAQKISFDALGEGVNFMSAPFEKDTEITGPISAKLTVSSSTTDADLFLVLRLFDDNMGEVTFSGACDPHQPIAQGWLRASHRKLDPQKSLPYRPWHTHDEVSLLTPKEKYELDIEIWPTCIVLPKGYRLCLSVRGKDYIYPHVPSGSDISHFKTPMTGCGPFVHKDPVDRNKKVFSGTTTLHIDPQNPSYILLPVIPEK